MVRPLSASVLLATLSLVLALVRLAPHPFRPSAGGTG